MDTAPKEGPVRPLPLKLDLTIEFDNNNFEEDRITGNFYLGGRSFYVEFIRCEVDEDGTITAIDSENIGLQTRIDAVQNEFDGSGACIDGVDIGLPPGWWFMVTCPNDW